MSLVKHIINERKINRVLSDTKEFRKEKILKIISKASEKKGLELEEVAYLLNTQDRDLEAEIFKQAAKIKQDIYGERLVFFAPLYVSNYCVNDCQYCNFHSSNKASRKKLSLREVEEQVKILIDMGHKRLLLEFGEDPENCRIEYVIDVIKTIYRTKKGKGEIRRVNVNIAATSVRDYQKLKHADIGTYQLFQETYHRPTYEKLHKGLKADYERQLFAHDRAFAAGIDDVGLGVLFGLYDYKFEVLALISHAKYLERKFGVGPHTISVPRWQPAETVNMKMPHPVSEDELLKIIAILRLAVPYTGMIISTRERQDVRSEAFKLGISQTSAASRTSPGGYGRKQTLEQFKLADGRDVETVLESILKQDLLPSFCTACYRQGRTGEAFMDIAKPGNIHNLCRPNAIMTFKEYLEDYATERIQNLGIKLLNRYLEEIQDQTIKAETIARLKRIEAGERDLYF